MAKILSIDKFDGTVLVNLLSDTGACVFVGEGGRRPLKSTNGNITRTFSFRITASTKALTRTAVNTFIASLRSAIKWNGNKLESNSIFLREAADGETAVRSLIIDFDASTAVDGSAIDAYQTMNTPIYVDVALTLQNLREEATKTAPLWGTPAGAGAVGMQAQLFSSTNTAPSRINMELQSTVTFANRLRRFWIGMTQHAGQQFQHVWSFDDTSYGVETTNATIAGSYSTLVTDTAFLDTAMKVRAYMSVTQVYTAAGATIAHAKGEYIALLRYKISAAGTYLVRGGITYYATSDAAYNEARLLEDDNAWHFMSLGAFKFPPNGNRIETATTFTLDNITLLFDAQRLSGTGHLYMDTITLIPADHFIHVDNSWIDTDTDVRIVTHENMETETFSKATTNAGFGIIREQNNWVFPKIDGTYVITVYAAERESSQVYNDVLTLSDFDIYNAYEAYNV